MLFLCAESPGLARKKRNSELLGNASGFYIGIPGAILGKLLCPPPWGVDILFLLFSPSDVRCPASGVRCPASRMVSAHLKEKY